MVAGGGSSNLKQVNGMRNCATVIAVNVAVCDNVEAGCAASRRYLVYSSQIRDGTGVAHRSEVVCLEILLKRR